MLYEVITPRLASAVQAIGSSQNTVYILDANLQEVAQFDLAGRPLGTYGEDYLSAPAAVAVDECGRVYVADGHRDGRNNFV